MCRSCLANHSLSSWVQWPLLCSEGRFAVVCLSFNPSTSSPMMLTELLEKKTCAIDVPFRADYSRVTYLCSLTSYESLFTIICCERKRLWWGVRAALSCESKGEQKAACCAIIGSDNSSGVSLRACDLPGHSFVVRFIVLGMNYLPVGQPLNLIRRLLGTPLIFISLLY